MTNLILSEKQNKSIAYKPPNNVNSPDTNGQKIPIRDEAPIKYYSMIPHLIDDADISISAHRLYCHLKRVAGETGACWKGQRELAKACHLHFKTIVTAKRELESAGLIRIEIQMIDGPGYRHPAHSITIIDIWQRNLEAHAKDKNLGVNGLSRCKRAIKGGVNGLSKEEPKKNNTEYIYQDINNKYDDGLIRGQTIEKAQRIARGEVKGISDAKREKFRHELIKRGIEIGLDTVSN